MDLAIALLVICAAYYINWHVGHKPINMILLWHLVRLNRKTRIGRP